MNPKAILFDSTLCVGCRECERACSARWRLPYDDSVAGQERLGEHKLTTVVTVGERFVRRLCMHCADPACASVCLVGALQKTAPGPVLYEEGRCIGCRYCMLACPFHVPVFQWSKPLPRVLKCDMCHDLLASGKPTACSEACPTGATITGVHEELVREAQRRFSQNPDQYYRRIYGLKEFGGTSVLMLSSVPIENFGNCQEATDEPLPERTGRALAAVPGVVVVGGAMLGGVRWITQRRERVQAAEGAREKEGESGDA